MERENTRTGVIAAILLMTLIMIGIVGFMIIEEYSFTEAFFMTIITMATVGFREVRPLSDPGMWFTSVLIIMSFGIFFYAVSTVTRYLLDGVFRNYYKRNKVKNKIQRLKNHVVICGYGRNGRQAANELLDHNAQIVVIEDDEDLVNRSMIDGKLYFVKGDATNDDMLELCNLERAKALITTLPVDSDNLFVVLTAREKNPNMIIISRASEERSDKKLKRAGATTVIMPDRIGGQQMAKMVAHPDVVEFLDFIMLQSIDNVQLEEIECDCIVDQFDNQPMRKVEHANESGANIIGLKKFDGSYIINPLPETVLTNQDKLFVLGTKGQVSRLKQILLVTAQ